MCVCVCVCVCVCREKIYELSDIRGRSGKKEKKKKGGGEGEREGEREMKATRKDVPQTPTKSLTPPQATCNVGY